MKDRIDFPIIKALLRKQWLERTYPFKRGNFDVLGFILRLAITAALVTVFVIFFGKFIGIYSLVKTNGALDKQTRLIELLTIAYSALILFTTLGCMSQISREIFGGDDMKIFTAMPVPTKALFAAKLIYIYLEQVAISTLAIFTLNFTLAANASVSALFYVMTVVMCFVVPFISLSLASVTALPFHALRQLLKDRFIISFLLVTVLTGFAFYVYSGILSAVKEMLLGDNLQYFFNERIMSIIFKFCAALYPGRWIANLLLGKSIVISVIGIVAVLAVCVVISLLSIRSILNSAWQSRMSGAMHTKNLDGKVAPQKSGFVALLKKEFFIIFRTPSYMFSYFSIAILMPLMVYSCMSIGSSLVVKLVALDCNVELALFLTLLFGALTNVFCATNISRDGLMFYTIKAMPVDYKQIFMSKVVLCLIVTALSQIASAVVLLAFGYIEWYVALLLIAVGSAFGFVNICVATRYDFNHARFSTDDDGEIKESSGAVSVIIVLGLIISFVVGGALLATRVLLLLRSSDFEYLTYLISLTAAIIAALGAYLYLCRGLNKRYYEFDGGNI